MSVRARLIESDVIRSAWLEILKHLLDNRGECYNLIVQIADPLNRDAAFEEALDTLSVQNHLLTIKHISYTIFPKTLWEIYSHRGDHDRFFNKYINRVYPQIKTNWGNYFHRMIHWTVDHGSPPKNQLREIIEAINRRSRIYKAGYTIQITSPMMNFLRTRGAPCLNYIALQSETNRVMNLVAVFRNHFLIPRIYGNYVGLGQLLEFMCERTGFEVGTMTCLSSHAGISEESSRPARAEVERFLTVHG